MVLVISDGNGGDDGVDSGGGVGHGVGHGDRQHSYREEQAVGDAMMFLTLVKNVIEISESVGIYLSKRLVPIYKRTLADQISSGKVKILSKPNMSTYYGNKKMLIFQ